MNLVIVESPTKARKLKDYLGKDFQIEASVGHIRDLPKSELGVDVDKNFEPKYVINPDKNKVVKKLRELAAKAENIYLATDPDREGEAIAWHIKYLLTEGKNKTKATFYRSTFHEITKAAVLKAINNPQELNLDLVDAQQARRVLDRLVGYQVSPVLWKKIRRGLSAGRVQSVALRLIAEREKEITAFIPEEYWEVDVAVSVNGTSKTVTLFEESKVIEQLPPDVIIARLQSVEGKKFEPKTADDVSGLRDFLPTATYTVGQVERKERNRASLPPFTTSTLQQAAASRLGFSSKQTMALAQQLYEEGLITYHRTDSFNLSEQSIQMARDYVMKNFGNTYIPEKSRVFAKKSKNAQEAHEAVRITEIHIQPEEILQKSSRFDNKHVRLYDLIWRRFVASQMESAKYEQTSIAIKAANNQTAAPHTAELRAGGSILKFDGWMKLFPAGDDTLLPDVQTNQNLDFLADNYAQKFTQPPARYNDASLVKELEQKGIGRPSTYASIISVIIDRGYVDRQQKRFFATAIGMTVNDFLVQYFSQFMEYDFTAEMEEDLDRISRGEKEWREVIKLFYSPLQKTISNVTETADRAQIPVEKTGEKCPLCGDTEGGEIVIRSGRFGKFKSCSRFPDCKFTENIVDKVPDVLCPLCQQGEVVLKNTRWGKPFFSCSRYPECDWASWKQPEPGEQLGQKEWDVMKEARAERKKKWEERKGGAQTKATEKETKTKSKKTVKKTKSTKTKISTTGTKKTKTKK